MRKNLTAAILAFVMILSLPFSMVADQNSIAGLSVEISQVEAATASITVNKADEATAQKVHNKLMKGSAITLKVKGSAKSSAKLLAQLKEILKQVNKQGVVFEASKAKTSGKYTSYKISKDQAETYKYAVKFVDKLFAKFKDNYLKDEVCKAYFEDYKKYPNDNEIRLRMLYDYIIERIMQYYVDGSCVQVVGYNVKDTQSTVSALEENCDVVFADHSKLVFSSMVWKITYTYENGLVNEYEVPVNDMKTSSYSVMPSDPNSPSDSYLVSSDNKGTLTLLSYEAFRLLPEAQEIASKIYLSTNSIQCKLICTENFCDLSDALKVYAINSSDYFNCRFKRDGYGMVYKYKYFGNYGGKGMKTLYDNKAEGVCQVYAAYECQLWDALGFTSYFCSNYNINHAWTVVKVKNSKGKTLWIPFDYGIGPAEHLSVSDDVREKYLKTEAMRYKLYLKGIKGAPSKKNFSEKDFN